MFDKNEILETLNMFREQHLDVRTITMGISLLDCAAENPDVACQRIYDKICTKAEKLVEVGESISRTYMYQLSINVFCYADLVGGSSFQNR